MAQPARHRERAGKIQLPAVQGGVAVHKLPDFKALPVQPLVGNESLRLCILHFRTNLGRDGYGPITKSLRLTEIPPP